MSKMETCLPYSVWPCDYVHVILLLGVCFLLVSDDAMLPKRTVTRSIFGEDWPPFWLAFGGLINLRQVSPTIDSNN